ncbi:MAG: hypothetical protein ACE361_12225 [Aureliella sp.]
MSIGENPYSPHVSELSDGIQQVRVRPIELMKRGRALMAEQYWLFFGIALVGILIGSAVPFGILLGPMMVGMFICYIEKERDGATEFGSLFKGFEQFMDAFLATLIMIGVSFVVMIPVMILFFAAILVPIIANGNGQAPPEPPIALFLVFYPVIMLASLAVYIPFFFCFQLIADRKLTAMQAVRLSFRGVMRNLVGVIYFMFVNTVLSFLFALMCYIPVFFFLPISFGALFVLYRDVFGVPSTPEAEEIIAADIIN